MVFGLFVTTNVQGQGRCAASSRSAPCTTGLGQLAPFFSAGTNILLVCALSAVRNNAERLSYSLRAE